MKRKMSLKSTLKSLLIIASLLLQFSLHAADAPPITVHVETAGTLPALIAEEQKYEITNLTLTGNLNGTDIGYIREMAGRNVTGQSTSGKLSILNLADANIVSGGDYYYSYYGNEYYTKNNEIGSRFFGYDNKLTSVTIPNSVTLIGKDAFSACPELTSVTIPNSVTSIEEWAFWECSGLTEITIPNSVTEIRMGVFGCCLGLTEITIPNSVTEIGDGAFVDCTGLKKIYATNPIPPTCDNYPFKNVSKTDCILYVPVGSLQAYKAADHWSDFENIVEMDMASISVDNSTADNFNAYMQGNTLIVEGAGQSMNVAVYNQAGVLVQSLFAAGEQAQIALSQRGVYIVQIQSNKQTTIKKIAW